ncbi:MAG: response regulator, partial [Chloroflexi bacterium]|nr:response regulator [Chloroflexota bacterium]
MKALIIEDSAEVTEAISVCLRVRWPNASLSSVQQGDRGMQSLESESFDVVFLDINLPDVSGFEVLKQIRS